MVPDLKPVLSIFFNGKLKEARITLSKEEYGYSGMSDPMATDQFSKIYDSKGFRELVQVLSEVYDDKALKGEKRWADFHSMMPVEREAENRGGKERVFVFFDAESDRIFDADPEVVNSAVREKIETLDGRFRRNGILLLIIGFGYQILAQIV